MSLTASTIAMRRLPSCRWSSSAPAVPAQSAATKAVTPKPQDEVLRILGVVGAKNPQDSEYLTLGLALIFLITVASPSQGPAGAG